MNHKNITRTAAIIYSEESTAIKSTTVQRKIIETIFVENENKELNIDQIIDELKNSLNMDFDKEEVENIINEKHSKFDTRYCNKENTNFIKLENNRLNTLNEREQKNSILPHIEKFITDIYNGILSSEKIDEILHKYLYELLNKNISVFHKIAKPTNKTDNLFIDPNIFALEEREAINSFLEWNNLDKNKSIFALISYSLEYAVVTNNHESSSVFLNSISKKTFFLDNNVLYRAIGLNGKDRKNRILTFLSKCTSAGQEFKLSKYSEQEFKATIKHNIKLLQKVPFRKINHNLFTKYSVDPSIYEYYHKWKTDRVTYSFELFEAHILNELDKFKAKFKIQTLYKIPFDEKGKSDLKTIADYQEEIGSVKGGGYEQSFYYDAINIYLIEKLRNNNNNTISDTKFFFVSTDQKLRNWDFSRTDLQPIALIPSQWMAVLLKYFSRTENDYSSYISFLKLKTNQPIISEGNLQLVLSGISEITEDFKRQETILEKMVELKFEGILNGDNSSETIYKNTIDFVAREFEEEIIELKDNKNKSEDEFKLKTIQFKKELLKEKQLTITDLTKQKTPIEKQADKSFDNYRLLFSLVIIAYFLIIAIITWKIGWEKMEPITYFLAAIGLIATYLYTAFTGKDTNPKSHFENKKNEIIEKKYSEFNFNTERYNDLKEDEKKLINEIDELNRSTEQRL